MEEVTLPQLEAKLSEIKGLFKGTYNFWGHEQIIVTYGKKHYIPQNWKMVRLSGTRADVGIGPYGEVRESHR